jgi:hypothetical protein
MGRSKIVPYTVPVPGYGIVLFNSVPYRYPDTRKCGRVGTCVVPVHHRYFVTKQLMGKASANNITLRMNPRK